jgi:hypothetical protein
MERQQWGAKNDAGTTRKASRRVWLENPIAFLPIMNLVRFAHIFGQSLADKLLKLKDICAGHGWAQVCQNFGKMLLQPFFNPSPGTCYGSRLTVMRSLDQHDSSSFL